MLLKYTYRIESFVEVSEMMNYLQRIFTFKENHPATIAVTEVKDRASFITCCLSWLGTHSIKKKKILT